VKIANHFFVERLAGPLRQPRLVVPEVYCAGTPGHEQRNHRFGSRLEMWRLQCIRVVAERLRIACRRRLSREQSLLLEQVRQGKPADATARLEEKIATRPEMFCLHGDYLM
jgi:hypothetical protein